MIGMEYAHVHVGQTVKLCSVAEKEMK